MQRLVVLSPEERLAEARKIAERSFETHLDLEAGLKAIYHLVHDNDPGDVDRDEIRAAAPRLLHELFAIRMALRDRIGEWQSGGLLLRPAEIALRDTFRVMRYASDILGEVASDNARLAPAEQSRRAFTGTDWNTLVHPAYDTGHNIPFRSGDVLLVRGSAHNSAAIARIGDVDTQFSHVALIYIDPEGKHWIVEALIEEGAVIKPLEEVLTMSGPARDALRRITSELRKAAGVAEPAPASAPGTPSTTPRPTGDRADLGLGRPGSSSRPSSIP